MAAKIMYSGESYISINVRNRRGINKIRAERKAYTVTKPKKKILQKPGNKVKKFLLDRYYIKRWQYFQKEIHLMR